MMKVRKIFVLQDIPSEVLFIIFSFLEPYFLCNSFNGVNRVCKEFNTILNSPMFWNSNKADDFVMEFVPEDDQYIVNAGNWATLPSNVHLQMFLHPILSACRKRRYSSISVRNDTVLGKFNEVILIELVNCLSMSLKGLYLVNVGSDLTFGNIEFLFRRLKLLKCFCLRDWVAPNDRIKVTSVPSLELVEISLSANKFGFEPPFAPMESFFRSIMEGCKDSLKAIYITDRSEFRTDLKNFVKGFPKMFHYSDHSPEELDFCGLSQHSNEEEEKASLEEDEKNEITSETINSETFHVRKSFLRTLELNLKRIQNLHVSYEGMSRLEKHEEFQQIFSRDRRMERLKRLSIEKNDIFGLSEILQITKSSSNNLIQLSIGSFRHPNRETNLCSPFSPSIRQQQPNLKIFEVSRHCSLRISHDVPALLSFFRNLREINIAVYQEQNLFQKIITTFSCSQRLEVLKIGVNSFFFNDNSSTYEDIIIDDDDDDDDDTSLLVSNNNKYQVFATREMGILGLLNFQIYFQSDYQFDMVVGDEDLLNLIPLYPNLNILRVVIVGSSSRQKKYGYMRRKLFPKTRQYQEIMRRHVKKILFGGVTGDPNNNFESQKIEVDLRPHLQRRKQDEGNGDETTILSSGERKDVLVVLEEIYFRSKWTNLKHLKSPTVVLLVLKYIHMRLTQNIFD